MNSRGRAWLQALVAGEPSLVDRTSTVLYGDAALDKDPARFIAVVPDDRNRFPRARQGEVGLDEGWGLAAILRETVASDEGVAPRPIVAIVDVASQAYGVREEMMGIHLACAAAVDAYASARLAGHPLIALLVGKAMSGAFLAHGYQANRILALDDPGVLVHAMGCVAAARVTRRSVAELDALGARLPPMSYYLSDYARLGLLHKLIGGVNADAPTAADRDRVRQVLSATVSDIRASGDRSLGSRLSTARAREMRAASLEVRRRLAAEWDAS